MADNYWRIFGADTSTAHSRVYNVQTYFVIPLHEHIAWMHAIRVFCILRDRFSRHETVHAWMRNKLARACMLDDKSPYFILFHPFPSEKKIYCPCARIFDCIFYFAFLPFPNIATSLRIYVTQWPLFHATHLIYCPFICLQYIYIYIQFYNIF